MLKFLQWYNLECGDLRWKKIHVITNLSAVQTAHKYKPQWKMGLNKYKPRVIMARVQYTKIWWLIFEKNPNSIKVGNLNSGLSYVITIVLSVNIHQSGLTSFWIFISPMGQGVEQTDTGILVDFSSISVSKAFAWSEDTNVVVSKPSS